MSNAVPTKSYARQYRPIWGEIRLAVERAFFEDDPVLGGALERFERALAAYHGVRTAVGVGSGTDAIALTLRELGVHEGCEVVTCAHTFSGVISAIHLAGARPVLVDADPETALLPPAAVEAAITPCTRAILAVHLYGHPADLTALGDLARRRGVHLIEDAAQAHGACWQGRPVGSAGAAAATSFHPSKNLGAFGDGGAVLTSDESLAARLRVARNLGKNGKYEIVRISPNTKLDTLQAAILEVKLRHLDAWVARRRELARVYLDGLRGVGDLVLPVERPEARHAYHLFVVRTGRRDALREHLAHCGVNTGLHYPIAAHRQPGLAELFRGVSFPVAERLAETVLTLPLSHELETGEIARVIDRVRAFFGD
ncbi:MAG: DegT/DnrJ/EryC1/StrS family aminotransferase [Polyangiaceae bacterium]|nr:DegT/DnrJ/EryC1/StrS family aminotransferase [Polyangiaceae bacterium]